LSAEEERAQAGVGHSIRAPIALGASRLVSHLLFGLTPTDPMTLIGIAAMIIVIGACAGCLPGRHASRVNPVEALRV
jgi:ABC-type antimicrobial peptide transport system permease subunit